MGALLVFIVVNVSLIVLRFKAPEQKRPFKVPVAIGKLPLLPIFAILVSAGLAIQYEWQVYAAVAGALVAGVVLDYFLDKGPKR